MRPVGSTTMTLSGQGITVSLPAGWEVRIGLPGALASLPALPVGVTGRTGPAATAVGAAPAGATPGGAPTGGLSPGGSTPDGRAMPVTHLASFALPADRGDFGSGAVDVMGPEDILIALVEYGPECVDTPLFARAEVPSPAPNQFRPESLQRSIPGQLGYQRFFTTAGRAFCLYVVLGSTGNARPLTTVTRSVLSTVRISPS
jgi:hypothetical protein